MKLIPQALVASMLLAASLAGCQAASPSSPAPVETLGTIGIGNGLTMYTRLSISNVPARTVMSTMTAYNLGDVDHVTLTLTKWNGTTYAAIGNGVTTTIANASLGSPIPVSNLSMGTQYKISAQAFASDGSQIDTGIATDNTVTFTANSLSTGTQVNSKSGDSITTDAVAIAVPVKLKNKTFAGQANSASGVTVTNGTIVNTTNQETF
jgi:hypothetical protein